MTDEEKAEEYVKTNHSHIMSGTMKSIYKKIYLDGLTEGRKEQKNKDEGFCELVCMKDGKIAELEKENADLQYKLKCRDDELAEATVQEEKLRKQLRRAETMLKLTCQYFLEDKYMSIAEYKRQLEKRAQKQEDLEDMCAEDHQAKIRMEMEEEYGRV